MEQEEAKTKSHAKMYYADVGEVEIVENDIIVKREIFENLLEIATLRNMGLQHTLIQFSVKQKNLLQSILQLFTSFLRMLLLTITW